MKDFFRNCIFLGKHQIRDKGFTFWVLIYPIIMAVLFFSIVNSIINLEISDINIGIDKNNPYEIIFKEIEFVKVNHMSLEEGREMLFSNKIEVYVDENLDLLVKESGTNQTIIKEILDNVLQISNLQANPEKLDISKNYIANKNQRVDIILILFYSLIAMVSTYGLFPAIDSVTIIQSNLSNLGQRLNITPLKKMKFLLSSILIAFLLNITSNAILLLFIKFVLKLDLFTEFAYSFILIIIGNLFGVSLGMVIATSNKFSLGLKTLMGISINLVFSFLAGMMSTDIKVIVDKKLPILSKINPLAIITNNFYKINLLDIKDSVFEGMLILLIYIAVLNLISYIFLRRRSYDSI